MMYMNEYVVVILDDVLLLDTPVAIADAAWPFSSALAKGTKIISCIKEEFTIWHPRKSF